MSPFLLLFAGFRRVFGFIAALRHESSIANSEMPTSVQIVNKISRPLLERGRLEFGFLRTTDYAAGLSLTLSLIRADRSAAYGMLGGAVSGAVGIPQSERKSAIVVVRDCASRAEWGHYAHWALISCVRREFLLDPERTALRPKLAGDSSRNATAIARSRECISPIPKFRLG